MALYLGISIPDTNDNEAEEVLSAIRNVVGEDTDVQVSKFYYEKPEVEPDGPAE